MSASRPSLLALVPARGGSLRVKGKNTRRLAGHPLIAYTIAAARTSGLFERIVVSTDDPRTQAIARHYGAEAPFLRPAELATSVSPDIEWIRHALEALGTKQDCFSVLRPTSPFRRAETIERCWRRFLSLEGIDSIRAVRLCHEHPGKMWIVEGDRMRPLLDQAHLEVPWHASQYQSLPEVYVQDSSLEIAWTRVVAETGTKEGHVIAPFLPDAIESLSIDHEDDWLLAERKLESGEAVLPEVESPPYREEG